MKTPKILLAAALIATWSIPAVAASVTTDYNYIAHMGAMIAPTSSSSEFRHNYRGSNYEAGTPNSRTPWESLGPFASQAFYNSVGKNGFAEYEMSSPQTTFSLIWGSPDRYNRLRFFDAADTEIFRIKGNHWKLRGTAGFVRGRGFLHVTVSDLAPFSKVRFESWNDAFEYAGVGNLSSLQNGGPFTTPASIAAPVPLPAAIWVLLSGLAALGTFGRVRRA